MMRIDGHFHDRRDIEDAGARFLDATGLANQPHLRLAICMTETVSWLTAFFAIRAIGASILPILPGTPYATARKLAVEARCHRLYFNSLEGETLQVDEGDRGPGCLLQMSSGTTGAAKCVARTWDDIERELDDYVTVFREPADMTPVVACPTTHSYGLICGLLVALKRGREPHVVNTANPKHLIKVLKETERPIFYSSPAMLHTLCRLLPQGEMIHAIMTSGTLLPEAWYQAIRARTQNLYQQYGCSEAGCVAINPDLKRPEDMGYILPRFQLASEGSAAAPCEIMLDGLSRIETKDLGYRRADGMLVFVSRLDDTINVSGLNVYPRDVEDAAIAMPDVEDAIAFRVADAFAGERIALVYSASRDLPGSELRNWCLTQLSPHQVPMHLRQVATIPRQANGKISRRDTASRFLAGEFDHEKDQAS